MRLFFAVLWTVTISVQGQTILAPRAIPEVSGTLSEARDQGLEVSLTVVDIASGSVLTASQGDEPRVPASAMKILSAGAALLGLGADHAIQTDLVLHGAIQDGALHGALRLRGEGDPTLRSSQVLPALVKAVKDAGITKVHGMVIVDDRLFDRETRGQNWPESGPETTWLAEVGALSLNHGTAEVLVTAGRNPGAACEVRLQPPTHHLNLQNRLSTVGAKDEHLVAITRASGKNDLTVTGKARVGTKEQAFSVAVEDPGLVFGFALTDALKQAGVAVTGAPARARVDENWESGTVLLRLETRLKDVLPTLLAMSQNHRADMLFKHLGAALDAGGTFGAGAAATRSVFAKSQVDLSRAKIFDGSGLSRDNRVTTNQLASALFALAKSPGAEVFRSALAVAGQDGGTLSTRLKELGPRVRAKTGTLKNISALAGYVETTTGKQRAFAILMKVAKPSRLAMRDVQDRIVRALAKDGA